MTDTFETLTEAADAAAWAHIASRYRLGLAKLAVIEGSPAVAPPVEAVTAATAATAQAPAEAATPANPVAIRMAAMMHAAPALAASGAAEPAAVQQPATAHAQEWR
jgi:hypothetical protein